MYAQTKAAQNIASGSVFWEEGGYSKCMKFFSFGGERAPENLFMLQTQLILHKSMLHSISPNATLSCH